MAADGGAKEVVVKTGPESQWAYTSMSPSSDE